MKSKKHYDKRQHGSVAEPGPAQTPGKLGKGAFRKWALTNRERLVLRFQLEQAPGNKLVELAEEKGYEVSPKDNRGTLVKAVMGELYPDIPDGYNRRKACRVLGIPTELKSRVVSKGFLQRTVHERTPIV